MKRVVNFIPNGITSLNLLSGCVAIAVAFSDAPMNAGYFILIAAVFDFFDGFAARSLNVRSEFGVQLDSLADMVSFGVAPAVLVHQLLIMSLTFQSELATFAVERSNFIQNIILYSAFLIAVFSALRLARFNVGPENNELFEGLTTTANGIFIASFTIFFKNLENENIQSVILNPYVLLGFIILVCYLLVSKIPMISLKFKEYTFSKNISRYIILIISLGFIIFFGIPGIALSIILYVVVSILNNWFLKLQK
ncbi:MAG: CDP-alcohol phosphatidyltransferase family protein [Bacteroidales bacterium]|nr:CDP-alcohol phosphatidyltransferase family protein [Bacteroidales bacterium]